MINRAGNRHATSAFRHLGRRCVGWSDRVLKPLSVDAPTSDEVVQSLVVFATIDGVENQQFVDCTPSTIERSLHPRVPEADGLASKVKTAPSGRSVETEEDVVEFSGTEECECACKEKDVSQSGNVKTDCQVPIVFGSRDQFQLYVSIS